MTHDFPGYVSLDEIERPPTFEPPLPDAPPGAATTAVRTFPIERWRDIKFDATEEWLIKGILPRQGLAVIFGKPGSFKSFTTLHIALCVSLGRPFAGRKTAKGAAVYIAAEGAGGIRKRKAGYIKAQRDLPDDVDFALIATAPNMGAAAGDVAALIAKVEAEGIRPAIIVIDTISKTLGSADENQAGMTAFISNAGALAAHFGCLVLAVHHVGLSEGAQQRMRGHSSLNGAVDAQVLCERSEGALATTLTVQKQKDDEDGYRLEARLSRVVLGFDEDGDEVSTLIIDGVTDAAKPATKAAPIVPRAERLLRDMLTQALDERGENIHPFANGPLVRAVDAERVRERYYAALAEIADRDEDADKLAERQRKAFSRAIKKSIDAKETIACELSGRRMLWRP